MKDERFREEHHELQIEAERAEADELSWSVTKRSEDWILSIVIRLRKCIKSKVSFVYLSESPSNYRYVFPPDLYELPWTSLVSATDANRQDWYDIAQ